MPDCVSADEQPAPPPASALEAAKALRVFRKESGSQGGAHFQFAPDEIEVIAAALAVAERRGYDAAIAKLSTMPLSVRRDFGLQDAATELARAAKALDANRPTDEPQR